MKKIFLAQVKEKTKDGLRKTTECLFRLCLIWSIAFMILTVVEFLQLKLMGHSIALTPTLTWLYLGVLTAYAGAKEKRKKISPETPSKPGEVFVFVWWYLGLGVCITHSLIGWKFPSQLTAIMGGVMTIFIGGKVAKYFRERKITN